MIAAQSCGDCKADRKGNNLWNFPPSSIRSFNSPGVGRLSLPGDAGARLTGGMVGIPSMRPRMKLRARVINCNLFEIVVRAGSLTFSRSSMAPMRSSRLCRSFPAAPLSASFSLGSSRRSDIRCATCRPSPFAKCERAEAMEASQHGALAGPGKSL